MNPDQFILEHWKAYGSYMERKERVIEVATTLYLTFVSTLLLRDDEFWRDYRGPVSVLGVGTALLVWWFVAGQMGFWTSAARMCNSCQTLMTRWLTHHPTESELEPVEARDFARVELPRALIDEIERRRAAYGQLGCGERFKALRFEFIVYGVMVLWTATLLARVGSAWCQLR